ncbi:MAG: YebC/PmpR family DNA-binding transcriptional regulator [Sodaliphilus pleomorphus]|jgi:YebC/PmpR family DNA-binding regulatory protein|uniref:YebC/PmpR family DNA-binding transcriptional regulator n=1 Tax=Sodaliphilus pleomorphus TaxID=2606626 RepID=UPI0023F1CBB1|nr:YebC/PmpR family DNA-binding transcriptional regulator [Sodaliphilus pleomorphus]MCI5980546.1 YebC/PmpR family DNA-binding transcriptional regulator [Muribaculaceae bacterium]MDD7065959.1 YebC/PmpR family DNA-binding transcriptional regulator [Sodaliphilus pleomorphus]MDY2832333.1 YebC/PmpR family DNA-binding transcriptional regulator [Sodaliphilus pleomorphus]
MGRAFEYRKARKLKRWGNMSRTFTRIGKEITIAVKAGGPDPSGNSRLRALIANAKAENMPKATWMNAIKKATESDAKDYKEVIYEGFAPNGIAVIVECATDNTTRTVANLRNYFNKNGGTLGNSGTTIFMFSHKCYFHVKPKDGVTLDDLELELIDCGAEDFDQDDEEIIISGPFEANGDIQKYLEDNGFEIASSELVYEPAEYKDLEGEAREQVDKLVEAVEEDEDVQNVFTNMREPDVESADE